ncbi:hypothetical protein [Selenomonas ruminantium]|uniref:Uncharacterized protein n=1 Tax=Selenomonas ruminantium TaxID=971 RepID=A0A1H0VF28_SELRU|nr:hypothetical protein [Selenomonas ruminantium]SDP77179.1 hypothetical protein SAMN05216366_15320 [Selenomonas ruminantium]
MARQSDYGKKIEAIEKKIAVKSEQLMNLKKQLSDLQTAAAKSQMEEVIAFITEKNLQPGEVLAVLKERFQ